jgi:hypothetical protein
MTLVFNQYPFSMLNNKWHVQKASPLWKFLEDKDDSDGVSGYLVFERIQQ